MARATQGLQVTLIISVMLNVVLGVTTYLYNKQAFEKGNTAVAAEGKVQQATKDKQAVEDKYDRTRAIIGNRELDIDAINNKFDEDLQLAGQAPAKPAAEGEQKPAVVMGYSQMVALLSKTVDDRTADLEKVKKAYTTLETSFHNREFAKDKAIEALDKGSTERKEQVLKAIEDESLRDKAIVANQAAVAARAKAEIDAANVMRAKADSNSTAMQRALADEKKKIEPVIEELRKHERQDPDPPSGEITWVNLPMKTVWINRGRADSLQRGIRFTVFAAESNTSAKAVEKGTVEVTNITGEHQAECRIVEDKFADPISFNDKIFTAFWSPGQQKHFVVTGNMNLDGDGRNQVNTAIGLIKSYGGVVDCWLDEQGHRQGQMSPATTAYLVQGDSPTSAEAVKANTEILRDASRIKLTVWSLADFKQRMNYQKSSSVEHFGAGASGGDSEKPAPSPRPKAPKAAASKADDTGL